MSELLSPFVLKDRNALAVLWSTHEQTQTNTGLAHAFAAGSRQELYETFAPGRTLNFFLTRPKHLGEQVQNIGSLAAGLEDFICKPVVKVTPRYHRPATQETLSVTGADVEAYGRFYLSLVDYCDAVVRANAQPNASPEPLDVLEEALAVCQTVVPEQWGLADDIPEAQLPTARFAATGLYLHEANRQCQALFPNW